MPFPDLHTPRVEKVGLRDAARVALEMGNSPSKLFRNYRELVTETAAKEWFGSLPGMDDSGSNVVGEVFRVA